MENEPETPVVEALPESSAGGANRPMSAKKVAANKNNFKKLSSAGRLARIKGNMARRPAKVAANPLAWAGMEAIQRLTVKGAEELRRKIADAVDRGDFAGYDTFSTFQFTKMVITAELLYRDIQKFGVRYKTVIQGPDGELVEVMKENPSVAQLAKINQALGVTANDMALTKKSRGESALNDAAKRELDAHWDFIRSIPANRLPEMRQLGSIPITIERKS